MSDSQAGIVLWNVFMLILCAFFLGFAIGENSERKFRDRLEDRRVAEREAAGEGEHD